jgi:hypothetical protein
MLRIIDSGILSRREGLGAYMPAITPLPDGTFIACQFIGKSLVSSDSSIEVLRSTDGGVTWVNEGGIQGKGAPRDSWAYRIPHIYTVPDGRLMMSATRFETGLIDQTFDPGTGALQRPEMLLFWSEDRGDTWSVPQIVPVDLPPEKYTCNGAGVLLQLTPDRWMYPLETWKPVGYEGLPDQKAAAVFSTDHGQTWGEFTVVADDPTGELLWWDQTGTILPDGRIYVMVWAHRYGTLEDLPNHRVISEDQGRTWSDPRPTNLWGQACAPIALPDGRVVTISTYRREPQGIRVALTEDLERYDVEHEVVIFGAGNEAILGEPERDNALTLNMAQGFGKPGGVLLPDGDLLTHFWCTVEGVSHTRWVRLRVED